MKLRIFKQGRKGGKEKRKVMLALKKYVDGGVVLMAVDDKGEYISNLFVVNSNGTYYRCEAVDDILGFSLDKKGRIKEDRWQLP